MKVVLCALAIVAVFASAYSESNHVIKIIPGGVSGVGTTTRYWDCCKPTCSWTENVDYKTPVTSCKADGVTAQNPGEQSGCGGGESYCCTNQGQYAVNDTLSYGFVGAKFAGTKRNMCCACVMFSFQNELANKKMVVQVTNSGSDAPEEGNSFDIAMPGSGVGIFTEGCETQLNSDLSNWGDRYGGVWNEADCYNLPKQLWDGCLFRFKWMLGVSNPPVSFVEVECPAEILAISNCDAIKSS